MAEPKRLRPSRRRATIRDVASRAGVSVATVSRLLNQSGPVRRTTASRVFAAIEKLRYLPHTGARSLSTRRTQTIGVVLPDLYGEFFSEVIRGIDAATRSAGYHILVSGWHSDVGEMVEMIATMRGRVDGLVVMAPEAVSSTIWKKLDPGVPVVLLHAADPEHDSITIDNFGGARQVMQHLAQLGHERIAFISGPAANSDARERQRGYRFSIRRLPGEKRAVELAGDFREQSGYDGARQILAMHPRPSAIFAANDAMAIGVLAALAEAGVEVPADMGVAGFDDIPIARYVSPPLTTVRVDIGDLGRRAVARLLDAMQKKRNPPRQDCLPTTLVTRRSTVNLDAVRPERRRKEKS